MTRNSFVKLISLILISGILIGCKPQLPSVEKAYPVLQTDVQHKFSTLSTLALSPDGQSLGLENLTQIQLETGNDSRPFDNYTMSPDLIQGIYSGPLGWSPDGRYLAATYFNDDRIHPNANHYPIYIYDTKNQTVFKANDLASGFQQWSPFNTGNYFAGNLSTGDWGVFNIADSRVILLDKNIDFRQEKELSATDYYLWSKQLDIPVAWLGGFPVIDENGKETGKFQLSIDSFSTPMNYENPTYRVLVAIPPVNNLIAATFDPTGTYILTLQLECDKDIEIPCLTFTKSDTSNITDSILTVINWKTGEQKELYRLSWIDNQNVVASLWSLSWSADGSTIVIGRKDSSPVVLRLSYP